MIFQKSSVLVLLWAVLLVTTTTTTVTTSAWIMLPQHGQPRYHGARRLSGSSSCSYSSSFAPSYSVVPCALKMASILDPSEEAGGTTAQTEQNDMGTETLATWVVPPLCTATAFVTYQPFRQIFHTCIDVASGNTWAVADGGKFMAEMVRPILNGPVCLSISILLGTLVATTISTLYNRQNNLGKTVVATHEQIRHLTLLVDGLPEPYREKGQRLLRDYVMAIYRDFDNQNVTGDTLSQPQFFALLLLLNDYVNDKDLETSDLVWQVYGGLNNLKTINSDFRSTLYTTFSPGHYANMVALACTILFVFLLETDQNAVQFLLGFQLSICWALLVGTYSLLAVVIYDLSTPFAGNFRVLVGQTGSSQQRELAELLSSTTNISKMADGSGVPNIGNRRP